MFLVCYLILSTSFGVRILRSLPIKSLGNSTLHISQLDEAEIPVIDIGSLIGDGGKQTIAAEHIGRACRGLGFFYISGHGVDENLQKKLENLSRAFFACDTKTKMDIRMELGGRFWRGYFPLGDELTSGKPDLKEGLYFGSELPVSHPLVQANTPMHGPNLFPSISEFRETTLAYMDAMTTLGHAVMKGISLSLGLPANYFFERYTYDPLTLFRIFHYPHVPCAKNDGSSWGVGAHTDYGLLTILRQDDVGGLQVKTKSGWVEAKPISNTFVVNIGDMLDRITGGLYRSTLHRVAPAARDRLSFPFFFDPNFFAKIEPIREVLTDDSQDRWDNVSVREFKGTYGEYLLAKVSKVFPQLQQKINA